MTDELIVAGDDPEVWFPPYGPIDLSGHYIPWPEDIPRTLMVGNEIMEYTTVEAIGNGELKITVRRIGERR